jgi:hypothetical protein
MPGLGWRFGAASMRGADEEVQTESSGPDRKWPAYDRALEA